MTYAHPKDSSTPTAADLAELLRLIEEDRAECAPPQAKERPMPYFPFTILLMPTWASAFAWLLARTGDHLGAGSVDDLRGLEGDRRLVDEEIPELIDRLYCMGTMATGELALAWSMMLCSPRRPASFRAVLPQVQFAMDETNIEPDEEAVLRARIAIWWGAARGDFAESERNLSMHALVEQHLKAEYTVDSSDDMPSPLDEAVPSTWFASPYSGPTMVVMPKAKATKLPYNAKAFEAILDKALPLVVARNLADAQKRLSYEFPHASAALSTLFGDLRECEPIRLRNTILLGPPGCSKSRLIRKFSAAIGIQHVHRVDAAASGNDSHFGGVSKSWSSTEPSVPARAVLASRTANPLVMVDELDKGSPRGGLNGTLWEALAGLADRETASRMRDPSLDAELDLSAVSFLCTANEVSHLPDYLKDRFRILRVPAPRLVDLPLLAGSIVEDMIAEDEWVGFAAPFASDELMVMAKAWEKTGFSMRKLQKIVRATLEARDANAMRH